jgi:hypothetical protein
MERARHGAVRRGITLTSLIEQGLQLAPRRPLKGATHSAVLLPECHAAGGTLPGVDLNDRAGFLERMDGRD